MKNKMRSISSIIAAVCIYTAVSTVLLMDAYSPVSTENVPVVILLLFLALAADISCIFADPYKAVSLASFALSVGSLCLILQGRISYMAFFFSGDVMGTGLSLFLILSALFTVGAIAASVVAVCSPDKKISKPVSEDKEI